jgi:hypothetical protein
MPKWLKIDEFRISASVPAGRTPRGAEAALKDPRLLTRLRAAVRQAVAQSPGLRPVRVTVSR